MDAVVFPTQRKWLSKQCNLELGDGQEDGDIWSSWYWVREAEGAGRGERWWSTVYDRPTGSLKLVACQAPSFVSSSL